MSNQLDNFFKGKLQNRTFEYDESAWEEARLLIEKEEGKSIRKRWLYILSGFFLLSFVGMTAFYLGKSSAELPKESTSQNENTVIAHTKSIENTTKNIKAESRANSTLQSTQQNQNNIVAINNEVENTQSLQSAQSTRISKTKTQSRSSIITTEQFGKPNTDNNTSSSENTYQNASGGAGNTITSNTPNTTYYNPNSIASTLPEQIAKVEEQIQTIAGREILTIPSLALHLLTPNEQEHNLQDLLPGMLSKTEGAPSTALTQRWSFGLRAGAAIVPSSFTDFDGGAFVDYQLNRNLSLSFQPHYTYQKTRQSALGESVISEFGFGLRSSAFTLSTESIRSFHAPLMVSFAFGNSYFDLLDDANKRYFRNRISVGVSYVYLDGVTGAIRVKEPAGNVSEFESGWLASDSFNRHNAEVLVGYERFLTKRLSIGLMARYRLKDQFSTIFIEQNSSANQTDAFYLGLQAYYKLF